MAATGSKWGARRNPPVALEKKRKQRSSCVLVINRAAALIYRADVFDDIMKKQMKYIHELENSWLSLTISTDAYTKYKWMKSPICFVQVSDYLTV
jgi:hypothetical protein